jgi:hypothetical protein
MTHHRTWRERIGGAVERDLEPSFEPSGDPTLLAFARLYVISGLARFEANKRLRTDALSPIYDCETESIRVAGGEPETFVRYWAPVWSGTDPQTGFRTGHDSSVFGTTMSVAMPQDERTAALLLLVTTTFVHLSGERSGSALIIRGAVDDGADGFRFVELASDAMPTDADLDDAVMTAAPPRER